MLALDRVQDFGEIALELFHRRGRFGADVEAQHRVIGHDIVRRAAFQLGRVHGQVSMFHRLQPQDQIRRRHDRIAPLMRIAPGMCALAGEADRIIPRTAALMRQGAIRQGRGFISQRG